MRDIKGFLEQSGSRSLMQALLDGAKHQSNADRTNKDAPPPVIQAQRDHSDQPLAERNVNMSNQLTRAAHKMLLPQKRIVALAIAKNDSMHSQHIVENRQAAWEIVITAKDYADTYGVDIEQAYEQLKAGVDGLIATTWEIVEPYRGRKTRLKGSWMHTAEYYDGKGMVALSFHPMIAPHILQLKAEFTTYKLKQAAALRSMYSWRLFECLMSWQSTGRWTVRTEEFRQIMEVPEKYKTNFAQIRRWIIEPAVKELREKQNWIVEWRAFKEGREVAELEFTFRPNPQQSLELNK